MSAAAIFFLSTQVVWAQEAEAAPEPAEAAEAAQDAETAPQEDAALQEGDAPADGATDDMTADDAVEEEAVEGEEGAELAAEGDAEALDATAAEDPLAASQGPGRFQPVVDLIEAGGAIIIILACLSVVSLAIVIVKVVQFMLLRVGDHKFVEKIAQQLKEGEHQEALEVLTKRRGVIARVMETALRGRLLSPDETHVREEVERVARAKLDGLERGLPLLSLVATISPLLGLLGTVLGMIDAFQQLENSGDRVDPAILSGGIWEALLTTAAGLSVAIPAAAFFTWLQRTVEVAGQHMEDAATRVFTAALYEEAARKDDDKDSKAA